MHAFYQINVMCDGTFDVQAKIGKLSISLKDKAKITEKDRHREMLSNK